MIPKKEHGKCVFYPEEECKVKEEDEECPRKCRLYRRVRRATRKIERRFSK